MQTCNDLYSLIFQKLVKLNIISYQEKIILRPYCNVNLSGKSYSNYIISCLYTGQKFFLKILKDNDMSSHCNDYLQTFQDENGDYIYPSILVPKFKFNNIYYFIMTFIEGVSLDKIAKNLSIDQWKKISQKMLIRLDELSKIHAPLYSENNKFTTNDCATILKEKFLKRFKHPLFDIYSNKKLEKAFRCCCQILDNSCYTEPTLLHMDIKPANIIYNSKTGFVTLIDFELARFGDIDYGWTQVLLSGINAFDEEYKQYFIPCVTKGRLTLNEALKIPKYQCYLLYQTACNLIYYYNRGISCPGDIKQLFDKLLDKLSQE